MIVGFPKCGTSALCRELEARSEVTFLRKQGGALEYDWPTIEAHEKKSGYFDADKVRVHKFTAYIYLEPAIRYLCTIPERRFVVCIRNPAKALISWHNMHRSIATTGRYPEHFAWKERDFYQNCSIPQYYERFARRRLRYDFFLGRLIEIVGAERVMVVSQERMARGIGPIADVVISFAKRKDLPSDLGKPGDGPQHRGFADIAGVERDAALVGELEAVETSLHDMIRGSGVVAYV